MKRSDFGMLVKALRQEHWDANDRRWTQETLAEKAGVSKRVIERIEEGSRKKLDSGTLLRLANALQLTSGERREFFLAASGVEQELFARPDKDPQEILFHLINRHDVYLPAYIIDSYCDVLAANAAILRLLDLEAAGLPVREMVQKPFGMNMLQYVFSPKAVNFYRGLMGEHWDDYAYQNMMIFRTLSLHHRSSTYFEELLEALKKYPLFRRYWREVYWKEDDHLSDNEHIWVDTQEWGPLLYFSASYTVMTRAGRLHFCTYVPATADTASVFAQIVEESGTMLTQLGSWPEKRTSL